MNEEMIKISAEDIARVKGLGFLMDKRTGNTFNARVLTRNGKITTAESRALADAADRFGSGEIAMTSRMCIEVQGIAYDKIDEFIAAIGAVGLEVGGTGPKVRPVVSCKGTTCHFGLIDTFDLAEEIHNRFYRGWHDVKLPHKFKIGVGGCPNNCIKPDLNDIGIIGQRVPKADLDKCRGCKKCAVEAACPIGNAHVVDGKIDLAPATCNHCGRCVGKCPFDAVTTDVIGYRICIGGRWGRQIARGQALSKIFTDREQVLAVIERALHFFKAEGQPGERFADTIRRLGFDVVEKALLGE